MRDVVSGAVAGLRVLGWSLVFYVSNPLLLAIALIPTVLRAYQLYTRDVSVAGEVAVEIARAVLFVAIIAAGRGIALDRISAGKTWEAAFEDLAAYLGRHWQTAVVQFTVLVAVVLLVNTLFDRAISASLVADLRSGLGLSSGKAAETRDAILFTVKNFFVIPLWVIAMLRIAGVIGVAAGGTVREPTNPRTAPRE